MSSSNLPKLFEYMKIIGQLKNVERTGWVRSGVKNPESVAEHMYRMAMIAFALPSNTGLDRDKCMKIALVHDMAESVVGDLTPWCGVSKEEKNKRESTATSHISGLLSEDRGKEMYSLWLEYENQTSPEAKFVKDLDKFEMLLQAFEYEELEGRPGGLQEFYDHTKEKYTFSTDLVSGWCGLLDLHRARSERAVADPTISAEEKPSRDKNLKKLNQNELGQDGPSL